MAMPPMIKELYQNKELGFLHTEMSFSWKTMTLIQYWKSFEQLESYAKGARHLKAWKKFNQRIGSDGTVGSIMKRIKSKQMRMSPFMQTCRCLDWRKQKGTGL